MSEIKILFIHPHILKNVTKILNRKKNIKVKDYKEFKKYSMDIRKKLSSDFIKNNPSSCMSIIKKKKNTHKILCLINN